MSIPFESFAQDHPNLHGGSKDHFGFSIDRVLVQGHSVTIPKSGVTAFVGGNNVGKSTLLRQIAHWIESYDRQSIPPEIVTDLHVDTRGTPADFIRWLYESAPVGSNNGAVGVWTGAGFLSSTMFGHLHQRLAKGHLGQDLGGLFRLHATTTQRLALAQPTPRRATLDDPPQNMLDYMEYNVSLQERYDAICQEAFDQHVFLDTLGAHNVLRIGEPDMAPPLANQISAEYAAAVTSCRPLHEQGDGMNSMMGLLLAVMTATYPVILVDEPEAFLHPPQARILGRELAKLAQEAGVQVLLATHDRHILQGLMDAKDANVSVVRLTRRGDQTAAHQLPADQLRELWENPILRYSSLLDGLFHRAVVLAEHDRDCRFYENALAELEEGGANVARDVHFVPTSGKTSLHLYASAMVACGVPTVVTADLDLLNDESNTKRLYEVLSGHWATVESDYRTATNQFRQPRAPRYNSDVLMAIKAVLNPVLESRYDKATQEQVKAHLHVESQWEPVKTYGMNAFTAERTRANRLLDNLDQQGLVLVRVGELEKFAPEIPPNKSTFVPKALEAGAHKEADAKEHARNILRAISIKEMGNDTGVACH
ncbi:ATP-dependent nuclease [Glutamicibacter nicotianae]|uniref:ATP-dependent nuclease n=1 Tax=Glutamicibacter nicotianae TaxID=37929 RepID=UPI000EF86202|nr:AAA family ATPase [Glutamicibacter nicotianae]